MQRLLGEYDVKLDTKGRFRLPTQLIRQLGEEENLRFVVNRGIEKHLTLYPKPVWDRLAAKLEQLSEFNTRHRKFMRFFYRGANEAHLDGSDRLLIPKGLQEYAEIEKDLVLFAYKDRIEIWAKEAYRAMIEEEPEDFADLAQEVAEGIDLDF